VNWPAAVLGWVAAIPPGRVATYGQIAALSGRPRAARQVGMILRRAGAEVPWHRVINAQGSLSTWRTGLGELQTHLLQAEGVVFEQGFCALARFGWQPEADFQPHLEPGPIQGKIVPKCP
jgi:methylated-DNA-protein-cysteine methyltransferase-like protein